MGTTAEEKRAQAYELWARQREEEKREDAFRHERMLQILAYNREHNPEVYRTSPELPWYVEHYVHMTTKPTDPYPVREEVRLEFPDFRDISDIPDWELDIRFEQSKWYLYMLACQARHRAQSYRGFKVGSAVLAFKPNVRHHESFRAFPGMNIKFSAQMRTTCSESVALGGAHAGGFDLIVGIVVVGILREEDIAVIPRLLPCDNCKELLKYHPISHSKARVFCAMPPSVDEPNTLLEGQFERGGFLTGLDMTVDELLQGKHQLRCDGL